MNSTLLHLLRSYLSEFTIYIFIDFISELNFIEFLIYLLNVFSHPFKIGFNSSTFVLSLHTHFTNVGGSHLCSVFALILHNPKGFVGVQYQVLPFLKVACVWVSALLLHAPLAANNSDMSSTSLNAQTAQLQAHNLKLKALVINHCMGILGGEHRCLFCG